MSRASLATIVYDTLNHFSYITFRKRGLRCERSTRFQRAILLSSIGPAVLFLNGAMYQQGVHVPLRGALDYVLL